MHRRTSARKAGLGMIVGQQQTLFSRQALAVLGIVLLTIDGLIRLHVGIGRLFAQLAPWGMGHERVACSYYI